MRPHTYDLDSLGWTPALAAAFEPHADSGLVAGRVGGEHRGRLVVYLERGERLAEPNDLVERSAVGDWVACRLARGDGPTVIHSVLPRTTTFDVTANVDLVAAVSSLAAGPNLRRLERDLGSAWSSGVQPAIVLTKADLGDDVASQVAEIERIALGVPILPVSTLTGEGVDAVRALVEPGRTAVLVGSSGAGKSSLVKRLVGRSTPAHRQLLLLPRGGSLIDAPRRHARTLRRAAPSPRRQPGASPVLQRSPREVASRWR